MHEKTHCPEIGTVAADGKSVTLEDDRIFAVVSTPCIMITENGVTTGYFLNADGTGPLATGKTEVYYCLGVDGQDRKRHCPR